MLMAPKTLSAINAFEQKLNYDKGDYAALRSYLDCDWDKHFDAVALDVDEMWNIFKTKIV